MGKKHFSNVFFPFSFTSSFIRLKSEFTDLSVGVGDYPSALILKFLKLNKMESPAWQYLPNRLSKHEINNPQEVVTNFFQKYDLPLLRKELSDWVSEAPDYYRFYVEVERFFEAIWASNNKIRMSCEKDDLKLKIS